MILSVEEIEKRIADSYELPNRVIEEKPHPVVSVRTSTYNHGPYIRQCIEGVLMQRTTFPFEFIIGEDFSTDETRKIVFEYAEKYPDIIRVITADYNVGTKANGRRCIRACRGKYIAICEGDDYWIDPLKLQKQVEFLEKNPEYGLVCTDVNFYYQEQGKFLKAFFKSKKYPIKYTYEDFLVKGWFIAPCTWVYKREFAQSVPDGFIIGDYPLVLEISSCLKIKFLDEVTTVYRVLKSSASHFMNFEKAKKYNEGVLKIQDYYMKKNGNCGLKKRILIRKNLLMIKTAVKYKKYKFVFLYSMRLFHIFIWGRDII